MFTITFPPGWNGKAVLDFARENELTFRFVGSMFDAKRKIEVTESSPPKCKDCFDTGVLNVVPTGPEECHCARKLRESLNKTLSHVSSSFWDGVGGRD